jgi:hypothetical protein
MHIRLLAVAAAVGLIALAQPARADVNVYAGYLYTGTGQPDPASIPTPFDPSSSTILISTGGVDSIHDTGVLRFENNCEHSVSIDPGIKVKTSGGTFQLWDFALPISLAPGQNLVLAETGEENFDTSDSGLLMDPIVSGSIDGVAFSFTDTSRILLGHEDVGGPAETTPYGLLGTAECRERPSVPEPGTLALLALGGAPMAAVLRRRRK